ncbi:uncharacterized protein DUF4961 [Flavobacteriaceae bacterium MAR_2010_72]|nr:uncharacterized protein DUF4961 [Flavobacteriaceae bacterium MAR_2010_72]
MKKLFQKINKKRAYAILLPFMFLALTMCITITGVNQPSTATIGETINITIDVSVSPAENASYNIVFGFLAPISWDVPSSAVVTYTSDNGDGTMSLAPNNTWSDAMKAQAGIGSNYGEVQWIAFVSDAPITGTNGAAFTGQVQLTVDVGQENVKTQLGYITASSGWGISAGNYGLRFTPCIEVSGGTNTLMDLCGPRPFPVTIEPENFAYNDIITITYDATKGDNSLLDMSSVYLCATATVNGVATQNCDKLPANSMRSIGDNLWEISIWPQGFFNLTTSDGIEDITFNFQNVAGDIIINNIDTGNDFQLTQNCN